MALFFTESQHYKNTFNIYPSPQKKYKHKGKGFHYSMYDMTVHIWTHAEKKPPSHTLDKKKEGRSWGAKGERETGEGTHL